MGSTSTVWSYTVDVIVSPHVSRLSSNLESYLRVISRASHEEHRASQVTGVGLMQMDVLHYGFVSLVANLANLVYFTQRVVRSLGPMSWMSVEMNCSRFEVKLKVKGRQNLEILWFFEDQYKSQSDYEKLPRMYLSFPFRPSRLFINCSPLY